MTPLCTVTQHEQSSWSPVPPILKTIYSLQLAGNLKKLMSTWLGNLLADCNLQLATWNLQVWTFSCLNKIDLALLGLQLAGNVTWHGMWCDMTCHVICDIKIYMTCDVACEVTCDLTWHKLWHYMWHNMWCYMSCDMRHAITWPDMWHIMWHVM